MDARPEDGPLAALGGPRGGVGDGRAQVGHVEDLGRAQGNLYAAGGLHDHRGRGQENGGQGVLDDDRLGDGGGVDAAGGRGRAVVLGRPGDGGRGQGIAVRVHLERPEGGRAVVQPGALVTVVGGRHDLQQAGHVRPRGGAARQEGLHGDHVVRAGDGGRGVVLNEHPLGGGGGGVGFSADEVGLAELVGGGGFLQGHFLQDVFGQLLQERVLGDLLHRLLGHFFAGLLELLLRGLDRRLLAGLVGGRGVAGHAQQEGGEPVEAGDEGVGLPVQRIAARTHGHGASAGALARVAQGDENVRVVVVDAGVARIPPVPRRPLG